MLAILIMRASSLPADEAHEAHQPNIDSVELAYGCVAAIGGSSSLLNAMQVLRQDRSRSTNVLTSLE